MPIVYKPQRASLLSRLGRGIHRTKRAVLNRRGDGVHSPYAFATIRQVFRNPYPYNAFELLGLRLQEQAPHIKALYGDRLIRRKSVAEVIFRLIHREDLGRIILVSTKESLLVSYLEATGKVTLLEHTPEFPCLEVLGRAELIIIEDLQREHLPQLECWLQSLSSHQGPISVLWHRSNPRLWKHVRSWRRVACPTVSFCSLDLELWVWRPQLTPGHYKVYSR